MSKPKTFQELETKAHDMEVTIASRCDSSFSIAESKRDRVEVKKNFKFSKNSTKETMTVSKTEVVCIIGKPNSEDKRSVSFKDTTRRHPTLKELQEKKYSFADSDLLGMLDYLLEKGSINCQSQKIPKRWEGLLTPNIVVIIGW